MGVVFGQAALQKVGSLGVELGDVTGLFPIPLLLRLPDSQSDHSASPCRGLAAEHLLVDSNLALEALTWLAGFREPPPRSTATPSQEKVQAQVVDLAL